MASPELSVVIPAFGRQDELLRAARSVLAQDVDLELLIVDDGSATPISVDLERVRVLRLDTNSGPAAARNAGVAAARADWIAFLDSDDVWPVSSLRSRLQAAKRKAAPATIWATAFTYVWPDGRKQTRTPRASAAIADFASGCWTVPGSTALFSAEAWRRSGGQDQTLRRLEDYEWLIRWGLAGGRIEIHPDVGAEIQRGPRAPPELVEAAAGRIRAKHAGLGSDDVRRRIESYLQLEIAAARLDRGDVLGGSLAFARSLWLKPRVRAALEPFWAVAR